jgi:SAM-dependent methyltransferase
MKKNEIRKTVRESYAKVAKRGSCCAPQQSCCGTDTAAAVGKRIGYSEEELKSVPDGSNLGLGCGNPVALASLKEGETVLDLGSGAGFDCFLAAKKVGKSGRIIGVDMTPEMLEKARENAGKTDHDNVEFRLGEIEHLPAADNLVDVVISNCVINLSIDKKQVFKEAFRVLKPGGRLMVSDLVLYKKLPDFVKESKKAYAGCVAGALLKDDYLQAVKAAGFTDVKILDEKTYAADIAITEEGMKEAAETVGCSCEEIKDLQNSIASISVYGIKPKQ